MQHKFLYLNLFFLLLSFFGYSQTDSLILTNQDVIVGEIKGLNKNVLSIETAYSDKDFKIEWSKIKRIKTKQEFSINLVNGKRFNGQLVSTQADSVRKINIVKNKDTLAQVDRAAIVFLDVVKTNFWSRLSASVGLGYNYTKAKNLQQFSVRSTLGYKATRWSIDGSYNDIRSYQDDVENVSRIDANLGYQYSIKKDWFLTADVSWLSNTAQNLDLRTLGKVGVGKFIIRTNKMYWGSQVGASYNNESYDVIEGTTSKNSAEAFLGSELNLYNVGDINLLTKVAFYPSLTESERMRIDYSLDLKYDLPFNFYINLGLGLNYDNRPVKNGSETDYVFQSILGWEW
ncbi:DUF481 domain-containing protein [Haloflavibacter putidus]|uniref:DUF481 domain-containing protein n=1 Tax=Haloflavibacter putidus TaxID=2576776 RepID=A0A507ZIE3_9FLAO|nr:DUF481 domain-containing protein [Haloflavibacter putidus]